MYYLGAVQLEGWWSRAKCSLLTVHELLTTIPCYSRKPVWLHGSEFRYGCGRKEKKGQGRECLSFFFWLGLSRAYRGGVLCRPSDTISPPFDQELLGSAPKEKTPHRSDSSEGPEKG